MKASSIRRSGRQKKPSLKSLESAALSPQKIRYQDEDVSPSSSESEDDFDHSPSVIKTQVIHESEHVSGNEIFNFEKRKKCEARIGQIVPKTPHTTRDKIKKNIQATIVEENSSNSDFSESGSEYELSEEESKTESSSESSDDSADTIFIKIPTVNIQRSRQAQKQMPKVHRTNNRNYTIKTDDYFTNHASKKIITSNHTLDKLETPRLPQDQLQALLSNLKISKGHETAMMNLHSTNSNYFHKWLYLMHENINILCYGLGSKKGVLTLFQEKLLKHLPTIVVHGFFPSLSVKDVLDGIIVNLLELKENPANIYEACDLIEKEFNYIPEIHLYLIVHNIDMMRGGKAQNVFARLAAIRNIHLIATIDHINAPLIWDHSKLSKFNFTWWDVSTFEPYIDETSFESSMMVQRTGTLALSSLRNVFLSLTSNSKGIYLILVKYQIENGKKQYYQGLAFKDLYSLCREAFLVSSDLALRAQLTEFVDHKMVKYRRSADGTENLLIPIPNTILQQFLTEQS